jgi:hypothetical protein
MLEDLDPELYLRHVRERIADHPLTAQTARNFDM